MNFQSLVRVAVLTGCFTLASCTVASAGDTTVNTSASTNTGGPVGIATDHSQYTGSEAIQVKVTNQLSQPIYAFDSKASCTILELQTQVGSEWQPSSQARCAQRRVSAPVKIDAGQVYTATISAGTLPGDKSGFTAGGYRLVLDYSTTPPADKFTSTTVYSALLNMTGNSDGGPGAPQVTPGQTPR